MIKTNLSNETQGIGYYLKQEISDDYKTICLGLGSGEIMAAGSLQVNSRWTKNTLLPPADFQIDGVAASIMGDETPALYTPASGLKSNSILNEWVGKNNFLYFSQLGTTYPPQTPTYHYPISSDACNGYVFIKKSSPADYDF